MRRLQALCLTLIVIAAIPAAAQHHPNVDRGFSPDKIYTFSNVDHVNTFNGNLLVTLPIGQVYPVSNTLSYGFSAVYNSNVWDRIRTPGVTPKFAQWPNRRANAGMGWSLTLGKLLSGKDPATNTAETNYVFVTPDGAEHTLYVDFPLPRDAKDLKWATSNSTYIRMRIFGESLAVDMPDGRTFIFNYVDSKGIEWRLNAIYDRYSAQNWVLIRYPKIAGYSEVWDVSDSRGRSQKLYFFDAPTGATTFPQRMLDRIETSAFGGVATTWQFNYEYRWIARGPEDESGAGNVRVALLTEIVQPNGSGEAAGPKFSFVTPGTTNDPYYDTSGKTTGTLRGMQLPTGGWIEWDFADLTFPQHPDHRFEAPVLTVGIQERRQLDRNRTLLGTWKYQHHYGCGGVPCQTPWYYVPCSAEAPHQLVTIVTDPDQTSMVRYFSIFSGDCNPSETWSTDMYGLPYTAYVKDDARRLLSWEVRSGVNLSDPGAYVNGSITSGTVLRRGFVYYHYLAGLGPTWDSNRREQSSRTDYLDDANCGTDGKTTCYTAVNRYGFDDFGHFRQESQESNIPGKYRTTFTNYHGKPLDSAWITTTYSEQCTTDEATPRKTAIAACSDLTNAAITKFDFDRTTGFLKGKRTLIGAALHKNDILALFEPDTRGNVSRERYYGGDTPGQDLPTASAFATPTAAAKYEITHDFRYSTTTGALQTVQSKHTGMTFFSRDDDHDASTGLIATSRDASGSPTSYTYDTLGRLASVEAPTANGRATSNYSYLDATDDSNAMAVETVKDANGAILTKSTYEYDGLGRLTRSSQSLPDGQLAAVQNEYDGLGRKSRVSQPVQVSSHPTTNIGNYWTRFTYDRFGRHSVITAPDNSSTILSYTGVRKMSRTAAVATSFSSTSSATTTETYDAQGRLVEVEESSGDTSASRPQGDKVSTRYTYDVGGRLATVNDGETQERKFDYDLRGFLTKETHPENGDTTHSEYDARGHARYRTTGDTTVEFVYDAGERLTDVKRSDGEPIKTFRFGEANVGDDRRQGKLVEAVRRNDLESAGKLDVTEKYEYRTPNGQMSTRTTVVKKVDGPEIQRFEYGIPEYDDLLLPRQISMPRCLLGNCGTDEALPSVSYERDAGYLTAVQGFGSLTYHPTGMVHTVTHDTPQQPADVYDARNGLARPSKITFSGCKNTQPYFLPGPVTAKPNSNDCGLQISWPAATLCGGVSNIKYKVLRNGQEISGCLTGTTFLDRNVVPNGKYVYTIVAEGPRVEGGTGACQGGRVTQVASKEYLFNSCAPETNLWVDSETVSVGNRHEFRARLSSPNGPVHDEELIFYILGKEIGRRRTAFNGEAAIEYAPDAEAKDWPEGIRVHYAGGLLREATAVARLTLLCDVRSYSVFPQSLNVLGGGGDFDVLVDTSRNCKWTPLPDSAAFFTVDPKNERTGTGTFDIRVPATTSHRSSHLYVGSNIVRVEQGTNCTYRFDPGVAYVPASTNDPTSMDISAPAGCAWKVVSDSSWLTLEEDSGRGNGTITFRVTRNSQVGKRRVGYLTLTGDGDTEVAAVNQEAPPRVECPELITDISGGTVENGQNISMRVYVKGTYLKYRWFINGRMVRDCEEGACGNLIIGAGGEGYPAPGQSSTFVVEVSNSCDSVVSSTVTWRNVSSSSGGACRLPSLSNSTLGSNSWPSDQNSAFPGARVILRVVADNWPNSNDDLTYQWFQGMAGDESDPIPSRPENPDQAEVRVFGTNFYWVKVSNKTCGFQRSRTAMVYVTGPPKRPAVGRHDFNGDNQTDMPWRNHVTGQNELWSMDRTDRVGTVVLPPNANLDAQLQAVGDLNFDNNPDLVWRDPETGQNEVWTMRGTLRTGVIPLEARQGTGWAIGAIADFDEDEHYDIVWHDRATGKNEIWFQQSTEHEGTWALPSNEGGDWGLHGMGDFNFDRRPDLFFHDRSTGESAVWMMNGSQRTAVSSTASGSPSLNRQLRVSTQALPVQTDRNLVPVLVADMNGDTRPDIVWRNVVTGVNTVWTMAGTTILATVTMTPQPDPAWQPGGGGSANDGTTSGGGGGPTPGTPTVLSVHATAAKAGTATAITATLKAGATALAQRTVVFSLNGTEKARLLTGGDGTVTAAVSVAGIPAGTYADAIAVRFDGDATYGSSSASANLVVGATPANVTWSAPAPIVYGTPLGATQLNATSDAAGTFVYSPASGAILDAGPQTLTVTFTPSDATVAPVTTNVVMTVLPAPSPLSWARPAAITYGVPLSAIQLNATSSVAGSFEYDPAAGTALPVGTARTLSVTFQPDSRNYTGATATTTIDVAKGRQLIQWEAPSPISFGDALSAAQLDASVITSGSEAAGALTYSPAAGTVLAEGVHELRVTAAATDSYEAATATVDLVVLARVTEIQWSSPAPIAYGTALSASQLNATSALAGSFVYSPPAGTLLDSGTHNLTVAFTPADSRYPSQTASVTIRVLKVKPSIAWSTPGSIVYGTPLSSAQLNAVASVPGSLVYTPASGDVLDAGTRELQVSFAPADARNYEAANAAVMIQVARAPQTIVWSGPAAIVYGTALSATQLNAAVQVVGPSAAGVLTYSPAAGTVLQAGAGQTLTVSAAATPNYDPATTSVTIDVHKATPRLTWPQPAPIVYKTLLGAQQLNATADVAGTFVYDPAAGTLLEAGTHTLGTQFTPTDTRNYNAASATVALDVQRADPVLSWAKPEAIVYGTKLGAAQLNATADVPGAFAYTPAAGTILNAGDGQTLSAHFTPSDARNYNDGDVATTIDVAKAPQTIVWKNPDAIVYGTALTATQLNAKTAVVGPASAGPLTYAPSAGTVLDAGLGQTLSVAAAETENYLPATLAVTLDVLRAPLSLTADTKSKLYGGEVPPLTGVLVGVVNGDRITPSYATTATLQSVTGTYPITATLVDPANRLVNYDVTITSSTLTVFPAPLTIAADAASKQYSDPLPVLTARHIGLVLGETPSVLSGALSIQTTAERLSPPGTYPIVIGGSTSTNYTIRYVDAIFTVTPEDARVTILSPRVVTAAPSRPTTLTLAASVRDISVTAAASGDDAAGDIRRATLTFVDRATDTVLCTAPIDLMAAPDERSGVAVCTATRNFGTAVPASLVIGARIGGYYTRDSAEDEALLSIVPPTVDFVTGAGVVEITTAAGPLAPQKGGTAKFETNLQYDKTGAVKGKFVLTFERTGPEGVRTYELTALPGSALTVRRTATGGAAAIFGTAVLRDVTVKTAPVVIVDQAPLIVTTTDAGEPSSNDTISVTFFNKSGGLWLATGWDGVQAVEQALRNGNVQVHYGR